MKESTLENFKHYHPERRCGNTTRLANHAIDILFSGKTCVIEDHYLYGRHRYANETLYSIVIELLKKHPSNVWNDGLVVQNWEKLELKLLPEAPPPPRDYTKQESLFFGFKED